jgi:hypothetical protein
MFKKMLMVLALSSVAMVSAQAAFIVGEFNLGAPIANVTIPTLNSAVFSGLPQWSVTTPLNGTFATDLAIGSTGTITNFNNPGGTIPTFLTVGAYTITDVTLVRNSVGNIWNLFGPNVACSLANQSACTFAGLNFFGTVNRPGFDPTPIIGSITAQYASGFSTTQTVSWSGNVLAPEPGTYALIGSALLGLGLLRRRKA